MDSINIVEIRKGHIPEYKHLTDACCDLRASVESPVVIPPKDIVTIPLGFAIELPFGYQGKIKPRSGLAKREKVFTINGTVDEGYTGEVCAIMCNLSDKPYTVHDGDRICQMEICEYQQFDFNVVSKLAETERGSNGFGSTGLC